MYYYQWHNLVFVHSVMRHLVVVRQLRLIVWLFLIMNSNLIIVLLLPVVFQVQLLLIMINSLYDNEICQKWFYPSALSWRSVFGTPPPQRYGFDGFINGANDVYIWSLNFFDCIDFFLFMYTTKIYWNLGQVIITVNK